MKRIFLLLTMAAVMLSCERKEVETPYTIAAKEIYKKYAPQENLTVALLGEYKGYNAVMLQAHTDEEWQFICKEFDIDPKKKMETTLDTKGQLFDDKDTLQCEGLGDILKMVIEEAMDSLEVEIRETSDSSVYSNFVAKKKELEDKMDNEQVFEDKPQRLCRYDVDTRTIWVYYYDSFSALNRITQDLIDTSGKGEEFEQTTTL